MENNNEEKFLLKKEKYTKDFVFLVMDERKGICEKLMDELLTENSKMFYYINILSFAVQDVLWYECTNAHYKSAMLARIIQDFNLKGSEIKFLGKLILDNFEEGVNCARQLALDFGYTLTKEEEEYINNIDNRNIEFNINRKLNNEVMMTPYQFEQKLHGKYENLSKEEK